MDDPNKNKVILVLVIGMIVFAVGALASCSIAHRQKIARDQEMLSRLEIEEKMNKLSQEDQMRLEALRKLKDEVEAEKIQHQKTKESLVHEQLESQGLREELQQGQGTKEGLAEQKTEGVPVDPQ